MVRCEVDHAFFYSEWSTLPDPSIPKLSSSDPLHLYIPIHIDDGLTAATNKELYLWFISQLQRHLTIIDLGQAQLYLGCRIIHDRQLRIIWLSQEAFISELLDE